MASEKTNNTIEITIVPTDKNWKTYYIRQIERIQTWLNNDFSAEKTLENLDGDKVKYQNEKLKEKAEDLIIDQFLSGKNIAGVGQGKFTNIVKNKIKQDKWSEIVSLLMKVKNHKDGNQGDIDYSYGAIFDLQNKLITICKEVENKKKKNLEFV